MEAFAQVLNPSTAHIEQKQQFRRSAAFGSRGFPDLGNLPPRELLRLVNHNQVIVARPEPADNVIHVLGIRKIELALAYLQVRRHRGLEIVFEPAEVPADRLDMVLEYLIEIPHDHASQQRPLVHQRDCNAVGTGRLGRAPTPTNADDRSRVIGQQLVHAGLLGL